MREYLSTRRIDELGRVVLPKEIRRKLDIKPGDKVEVYFENNEIRLVKPGIDWIVNYINEIEDIASTMSDLSRSEYGQLCSILNKLLASCEQVKSEEVD
jgi:AbrB family looped-hinge helix DNA binding protein